MKISVFNMNFDEWFNFLSIKITNIQSKFMKN